MMIHPRSYVQSKLRLYVHEYRGYLRETQLEAEGDKCKGKTTLPKVHAEVYDTFLKLKDLQRWV